MYEMLFRSMYINGIVCEISSSEDTGWVRPSAKGTFGVTASDLRGVFINNSLRSKKNQENFLSEQ